MTEEQALFSAIQLHLALRAGSPVTGQILRAGLSPQQVWDPEQMRAHGLAPLPAPDPEAAQQCLQRVRSFGMRVITAWDEAYPPLLREIYAPPLVLFAVGTPPDWSQPTVAMVGTRHSMPESVQVTQVLARGLAAGGAIVVSGGAVGIDRAAHEGALAAGGVTVDVMPCGLDISYPRANETLRQEIVKSGGLLLSEYPPGVAVNRGCFGLRNRLIAGMCAATCVIEAPAVSGALITARLARDQGRDVYAVAGDLLSEQYAGSRDLLRDGAVTLIDAVQVLQDLEPRFPGKTDWKAAALAQEECRLQLKGTADPPPPPAPMPRPIPTHPVACPETVSPAAAQVYELLKDGPLSPWELAERIGQPAGTILARLTELEISGCVEALPGPAYAIRQTGRNR